MAQVALVERVLARCRAAGIAVRETSGWQTRLPATRGRVWAPVGFLVHHTAGPRATLDNPWPSLGTVLKGRPDLSGPLCQTLGGYDGSIWVVTADYAHHAGEANPSGPVPGGDGNRLYWGHEIDYYPDAPMSPQQYRTAAALGAIVTSELGHGPEWVRSHAETSKTGKWDPGYAMNPNRTIDMTSFRNAVRLGGPIQEVTDDMYQPTDREFDQAVGWRAEGLVLNRSRVADGPDHGKPSGELPFVTMEKVAAWRLHRALQLDPTLDSGDPDVPVDAELPLVELLKQMAADIAELKARLPERGAA